MCGKFNYQKMDDFTVQSGIEEPTVHYFIDGYAFGGCDLATEYKKEYSPSTVS